VKSASHGDPPLLARLATGREGLSERDDAYDTYDAACRIPFIPSGTSGSVELISWLIGSLVNW